MVRLKLRTTVAVAGAALLALAGCTTHKTEAPSLTGPSELGTSVTIEVSPDVLAQDGASQSLVTVTVRDSNGQPLRNVAMRANITVGGVVTDFGTLSAKNLVSDTAGRASVVYTAPPAPAINVDTGTVVTIDITPTGTNFGNTVANHVATIRLVPPGTVGAAPSPFKPSFVPPGATAGDAAVFSASVVDASGNDVSSQVVSYSWTFGDGTTASGRSVSKTFSSAGSFPVTLRIVDALGRTAQFVQALSVGAGSNPGATFLFAPSAPSVGQQVSFNGSQSTPTPGHPIVSYTWDFGDGSGGSGPTTTHAYSAAGQYIVTLTTKDDVGRTSTPNAQTITVSSSGGGNTVFTFSPSAPLQGQNVTFDATSSTAGSGRKIVSYAWNFDDGTTGSGVTTSHAFSSTRTFAVRLTTTDDLGQISQSPATPVPVGPSTLTASFTFTPSQPLRGQAVSFDASQSRAASGRTITQYAWNFDDGATAFGVTTQHAFNNTGPFQVRLTITDDIGQTSQVQQLVTVGGATPTAGFTFTPSNPTPGDSVQFDASSSRPATGRTITQYAWNFDDGTTGVGIAPQHTFTTARPFNVRLTVTDDFGQTATTSQPVTVGANPPTADFTFLPTSPDVNQAVNFDAFLSKAGTGRKLVSYAWNFGDGAIGAGIQASHSYSAPSTYTVLLTVTDDAGQTQTASKPVTVGGKATAIFFYSPDSPGNTSTVFTFDASQSRPGGNASINHYEWTFNGTWTPPTSPGTTGTCVADSAVFTTTSPTITHQYPTTGTRCIILTVVESTGERINAFRPITIQ